jgi:hypothetical protein
MPVWSRNLDKNPFTAETTQHQAGIAVNKKTLKTAAFISMLIFSAVAATCFLNSGQANPYNYEWKKQTETSPPEGTLPPTIQVLSPENNTAFASNNITLTLNVSMPESNNVSLYVTIYYTPSWQHDANGLKKIRLDQSSINLTDIPEGPRWIEIEAVATGYAYDLRHEIKDYHYITYYVGYKITSSSVINFIIDNTAPTITSLSVDNKTHSSSDVPLTLTVNEPISQVNYSVDGQRNATTAGNTTLTNLPYGEHNVTVYATDMAGHTGASETVYFSVEEPFPTTMVITPVLSVVVLGVGLAAYFKKHKH